MDQYFEQAGDFCLARTVYKNCVREYRAVKELFDDVMERLQEFN